VFAKVEIELWTFATAGGHPAPPPYVVRYDLARWLWHPSIDGAIFCLRCGDELHYRRRERPGTRMARCRSCSRGRVDTWPGHALEPYRHGTWLLRCDYPGCAELFVGRRQARRCGRHRTNRLGRPERVRPE
jgi:hypothetical protein